MSNRISSALKKESKLTLGVNSPLIILRPPVYVVGYAITILSAISMGVLNSPRAVMGYINSDSKDIADKISTFTRDLLPGPYSDYNAMTENIIRERQKYNLMKVKELHQGNLGRTELVQAW